MIAIGIDAVDIGRMEKLSQKGREKLKKIFTEKELEYCFTKKNFKNQELAARFAAKEAVSKALGVGLAIKSSYGIYFTDVELLNDILGKPFVNLYGRAKKLFYQAGFEGIDVAVTHERGIAIVAVVLWKKFYLNCV